MIQAAIAAGVGALSLLASVPAFAAPQSCAPAGVGVDSVCDVGGVRIAYVDWGGKGPAVILLAGLGDSARIYDELAPKLAHSHRVIAVTRRGYGLSDHTQTDYSNAALVNDILGLMDRLGIEKASFVGHSLAGGELSTLAADHPDRVERLVYLDAAYDRTRALELTRGVPSGLAVAPSPADAASLAGLTRWREATLQAHSAAVAANVRALYAETPTGPKARQTDGVMLAILRGDVAAPPRYAAMAAPALAIYTSKDVLDQLAPDASAEQRGRILDYFTHVLRPWMFRAQADFLEHKRCGAAIELPHSTHYFFLRAPDGTAALIDNYLASPNPCAWRAGDLSGQTW